jgi:orotate phosphoribosyltransferase
MKQYQKDFIQLALEQEALKFGQFTLKSGRISPYFFNAGLFRTGEAIYKLACCYAEKIIESKIEFEVLFGPAYKGIPLSAVVASVLYHKYKLNIGYAFNRKEAKDHGEGGIMVGESVADKKVLIIDDVITAGTAIREGIDILSKENAEVVGIALAVDREEKGKDMKFSAVQEVKKQFGLNVLNIVGFSDIIEYASQGSQFDQHLASMKGYQSQYGI